MLREWFRTKEPGQVGFTLIELLLYVAIVGTLLMSLSSFFIVVVEARVKNQSISEVNQQGEAILEHITAAARNANSITTPAAGASGASLTLAMPAAGANPTVFDLSGTTMQIKEGAGAAVALTNSKVQVSGLTFKNLSRPGTPGVIQISFTVSRVNTTGKNEYDYQKTFIGTASLR